MMTRATRRAVNFSGTMPCDMCGNKAILEEHHISGRKIKNYNHPSNLANICANDHSEVHAGRSIIEKWVSTSSGKVLLWHKVGEESLTGCDSSPYIMGGSHAACKDEHIQRA